MRPLFAWDRALRVDAAFIALFSTLAVRFGALKPFTTLNNGDVVFLRLGASVRFVVEEKATWLETPRNSLAIPLT